MKRQLDESVPRRQASSVPVSFTLRTTQEVGWRAPGTACCRCWLPAGVRCDDRRRSRHRASAEPRRSAADPRYFQAGRTESPEGIAAPGPGGDDCAVGRSAIPGSIRSRNDSGEHTCGTKSQTCRPIGDRRPKGLIRQKLIAIFWHLRKELHPGRGICSPCMSISSLVYRRVVPVQAFCIAQQPSCLRTPVGQMNGRICCEFSLSYADPYGFFRRIVGAHRQCRSSPRTWIEGHFHRRFSFPFLCSDRRISTLSFRATTLQNGKLPVWQRLGRSRR